MGQLKDILDQKRKMDESTQETYDFDNLRTILERKKEMDYAARQENYLKGKEIKRTAYMPERKQKVQEEHSKEKSDFFREDRERADKLANVQRAQRSIGSGPVYPSSPFAPIRQTPGQRDQIKEYTNQLAEKTKQERQNKLKREQEQQEIKRILDKTGFQDGYQFKRYADLSRESDFTEMVQSGSEKPNVFPDGKIHTPLDILNKEQRDAMIGRSKYNYMYMTDTEKDMYHYINGKYGADSANNYLGSIGNELNRRSTESYTENAEEFGKLHPVTGTGVDAGMSLLSGVTYPMFLAEQAYKTNTGKDTTIDPYASAYFSPNNLNEALRSGIKQNEGLKQIIPNDNLRGFLTDTGLSMTENIARLPLGGIGLISAAGGAGLSGTKDAVNRGGSEGQAVALGIANAGAEAFFEKFSLEGMQSLKAYPAKGAKEFLKNMGKQAITEGSEEVFTELANTVSDQVIMDGLSQYNLEYEQYVREGMSEKEAKEKSFQSFLTNVALSGAGGALSGGILGAGGQAVGLVQENTALNRYGRTIEQDYRDYAKNIDMTPENYVSQEDYMEATNLQKLAEEYANRQKQGEFIKNREKAEYDLRFQKFQDTVSEHNNLENGDVSAQNGPQEQEMVTGEESQRKPAGPEYGPADELEVVQAKGKTTAENAYIPEWNSVNQAEAYRNPYGENGGKALEDSYDGSTDISTYNRAFGRIYDAGRYDIELSVAENSAIVSILTPEQVTAAYKAGAQDRNHEMQIDIKTGLPSNMVQGEAKTGGLGNVTEYASDSQKTVAEHVGKMTGLKINLVDDMGQGSATASYRTGEITLSVNASDFNGAMSHELTHFIKDYANDAYNVYTKYAVKALMESESVSLEDLIDRYNITYSKEGQELSREEIMDEIVADATQRFFNDSKFADSIVTKDRTLAQKIVNFFTDVVEALKSLMKTGSSRQAAKGLEEKVEYFEGCRDIWMNAAGEAGERYKSGAEIINQGNQTEKNVLEKPDQVTEKNIEENHEKVRNMNPVTELTGEEFPKGEKKISEQVRKSDERYELNQFGMEEFTEKEKEWWKDSNIILCNRRQDIIDFCNENLHKKPYTRLYIGKIGSELAERIYNDTGIELEGYNVALTSEFEDSHGDSEKEKARGQIPVTPEIISELPLIISQYDEVEVSGTTMGGKPALKFVKDISGKRVAVEYVRTKRKQLELQTLYAWGDKNNRNVTTTITMPEKPTRTATSETYSGMVPIDSSISQSETKINQKFQLEDVDNTVTQKRIEALLYENQTLKEANELLEKQFEVTPKSEVRQQDINKVAKGLLKEYNSSYKQDTLIKNLDRLYGYIRGAEHVDGGEVTEAATSIAKSILKQSQHVDTELTQQYKDLRSQIKNTKIKITDQDKADLASAGGYNEFRKKNFGRMKLGSDGISVDSLYQELSEQHPELFPVEITHPADQLMAIADAMDQTDVQVRNPYHANIDEMAYMAGQDIVQSYFDVRQAQPTFADRKAAEVQRVKRDYSKKMSEYKDNLKQQYENNLKQIRKENIQKTQELSNAYKNLSEAQKKKQLAYYRDKMADLRNYKNQNLAAMQKRNREQIQKIRDNQKSKESKKIIIKETKAMQSWLLKPTDAKHVPEILRTTVAQFLGNIDFSSNELNNNGIQTQRTDAWQAAKNEFQKIIDGGGVYGKEEAFIDIDPDLAVRIEELLNKTKGMDKLDNLNAYTMEELKKVVISMKKAITEANSLKSNKRSGQLSIVADGAFRDLENLRNRAEYIGPIGITDKMLNYDMLDPQTMFAQMGDHVKSTYDELRDGLNRKTVKLRIAQKYVEDIFKKNNISYKDVREWTGEDAKPIKFRTSGGTIELTTSQVMSLYELDKRNQAKVHMYDRSGGIKPAERNGKLRIEDGKVILPKKEKSYYAVNVSEEDVKLITNTLTPAQKALADGMQRFMGDECAAWGNEVTMEMYGYQKFTARNYFPITTDDNFHHTRQGDLKNKKTTIKNLGFTKSTVEHANKPILIEDIFDVYSRQVDQMSTYNAYVIPLSDLNKVFNYIDTRGEMDGSSIKQEIERTFGKSGNEYIDKLLEDINGSINSDRSIGEKMLENMKAASVAGNLRVAIQQPTAYIRASMEMDTKYLLRGAMTMTKKGQWDLICQYAPIAQWKDWGFYRMDTSRKMKDIMFNTDSKKQRLVNKTMVLAEQGDKLTWNRLWRACEFECMDMHPELEKGTETYYKEVGRRFSEIIDKTQVVDSVLHRTQIMRSQNALNKVATSFMAEPLKTYNMLYRAAMDVRNGKDKSKRRAARAATVFVVTNVATALAAAAVDAARDDDRDKRYGEKYRTAAWQNFCDGMNIINNIPYIKDAVSIVSGYSPTRADTAAYQDLYYAWKKLEKVYSGESNLTPQYVALFTAEMTSKLFGIPIRSISRDAQAITDTLIHEGGSDSTDYKWLKQKYAIGSKENLSMYAGMMIEAYRNNDKEFQEKIKTDLNNARIDNETISGKIKTLIKGELISKDSVDPRIDEAAKAKSEMDLDTYESAVTELMEEGYAGKLIESAITARMNQLSGDDETDWEAEAEVDPDALYREILTGETAQEDEWNLYSSKDIISAVELFDRRTIKSLDTFNHISNAIIDSKIKAGKTKKEAITTIKSSITKKYKADWIAAYNVGNNKAYKDIMVKLQYLKVDGKILYSGTDWTSWRKEAREKAKE